MNILAPTRARLQIEVVFDLVCPWCYLGVHRLRRTLRGRPDLGADLLWRPFLLNPDIPSGGIARHDYMLRKFGGEDRARRLHATIADLGRAEGLRFAFDRIRRIPPSVDAHRLVRFADRQGLADAAVHALFEAYFCEGQDIGDQAALAAIAEGLGLDGADTRRFLGGQQEAIGGRVSDLALLQENPQALEHVAGLVTASSWLAQYLNQHPLLLDELLDPRNLATPADWPALFAGLHRELDAIGDDTEVAMDALRQFRHAQTFRLVARGLSGMLTLEALADELTALADGALQEVVDRVWTGLRGRHCEQPRVCVIGYGKLGGKELSFASDLDLVWVHDDDHPDAGEVYSRLVQRSNGWLNRLTAAGVLYETDLRLRPDGDAGLLVCGIEHWRHYLEASAWTWELQALTRARATAGDASIGARVEAIRRDVLAMPRDAEATRRDIVDMRRRMLDAHRAKAGIFNLKQDRGGIIDTEFVVQYWILAYAHRYPELLDNVGTLALLGRAAALGLVDSSLASRCQDAYRRFRQRQHLLRLNAQGSSDVAEAGWADDRSAIDALWNATMGSLPDAVPALHGRMPPT